MNHAPFIKLADRIAAQGRGRYVLIDDDLATMNGHINWFRAFLDQRKRANGCIKNHGRKRLPDDEVQPESLRRRELRGIRVVKGNGNT